MEDENLDLSADPDSILDQEIDIPRLKEDKSRIQLRQIVSYVTASVATILFAVSIFLAFLDTSDRYVIGIFVASATLLNLKVLGTALPDKEAKESSGHPLIGALIRVLDAWKDYMNKKQS